MWNKFIKGIGIGNLLTKKEEPVKQVKVEPEPVNYIPCQRMQGYIDFKVSNDFISYITIDNTRLYYNPEETIQVLQDQFFEFHKKELKLENSQVKIDPEMKVSQLIKNQEDKQILQKIFIQLESQQTVIVPAMAEQEKLIITKIAKQQKKEIIQKVQIIPKKKKEKKRKDVGLDILKPTKQFGKQKQQKTIFQQYVCEVHMHFGPRKPKKIKFQIKQSTTFNHLINELQKQPLVKGGNIQFSTKQGQVYDPSFYHLPITSQAGHKLQVIICMFSSKNSYLKSSTNILIGSEQNNDIISLDHLKFLEQMLEAKQNQQITKAINYDIRNKRFQANSLTNLRVKMNCHFVRLQLQGLLDKQGQKIKEQLQATPQTRVLFETQQGDLIWIPISLLKKDDQICGIMRSEPIYIKYKVIKAEVIQLEQPHAFYSFSAKPYLNFIGNNIIIHNCNPFSITVYSTTQIENTEYNLDFHRGDTLNQHFGDKICISGGIRLNNQLTFGDYQLQHLNFIHIYENQNCIGKRRQQTLTERKKRQTISKSQNEHVWQQEVKSKLRHNYFGIYNNRLIGPKQIQQQYSRTDDKQVDIIIDNRTVFQRLNYYINKLPKYSDQQKEVISKYLYLWEDVSSKLANNAGFSKQQRLSREQMLGIYLYTSNLPFKYRIKQEIYTNILTPQPIKELSFYNQLNGYLREKYLVEDDDEDNQFLPAVGWLLNSIDKTKKYSTKPVYRGIKNILLEKALGLREGQPISLDSFIVFNSFTSTSTNPKVAQNFASQNSQKNVLLTIYVRNGRNITNYSAFSGQQQILIPPFTYFVINSFNLKQKTQVAQLQQIPMPQTNSSMLLFWVDDNPSFNQKIIQSNFKPLGIQVIQIVSTRIMKIILHNFLWIFRMMGKKVVIVSDMTRIQNGVKNDQAGIDLFLHISEYGFSNKAIIFAGDVLVARRNLANRGIDSVNWRVTAEEKQLIQLVKIAFQINTEPIM